MSVENMSKERIVALLETHCIKCCVDIRNESERNAEKTPDSVDLQIALKQSGIFYLSFDKEFGSIDTRCYNRNGTISFRKALANDSIVQGFERLNNGLNKGYTICVIDNSALSLTSTCVGLIGRYYSDRGHEMQYIGPTGELTPYSTLIDKFEKDKASQSDKTKAARELGEKGEMIACLYLEEQGYQILAHNWNLHYGCEIDIIAFKDNRLHFIEVKTRRTNSFVLPEFAVNKDKIWHIAKAARRYVRENYLQRIPSQIDCIAIVMRSDDDYSLKFIEDIKIVTSKFYY